jgi:outer membrane scaffolding protein for murein synthesis (MipA/OmpV family)
MNDKNNHRYLSFVLIIGLLLGSYGTRAQTPSPLQEWQYSGGSILARLFDPDLPTYRTLTGLAAEVAPVYEGSRAYRVQGGPVINFQYKDVAFIATGNGIGYNVLRGDHYQVGVSMGYDLGRRMSDDYTNLKGMGDIGDAPVAKVFATWVASKSFPFIMRADARQFIGGAEGAVGDLGAYMPLPGSSRSFVMFAGPSVTVATRHYLQTEFGVSQQQALASGHPEYLITHSGISAVGAGFSATKFVTPHWLVNIDAAVSRIWNTPAHSPLVERTTERVVALSVNYQW